MQSSAMASILPRIESGDLVRVTVPMLHVTEAPTSAPIDTQHDLMLMHPTINPSLIHRWRPVAFLHYLQTLVMSCTRHCPIESRWIRPGLSRWESVPDLLARQHTHLYINSLLG